MTKDPAGIWTPEMVTGSRVTRLVACTGLS
jgi:hypothetical protein